MLRIAQFVLKIVKLSDNIGGRADPNTYGIHPQFYQSSTAEIPRDTTMSIVGPFLLGYSPEECQANIDDTLSLYQDLGFLPHEVKSVTTPTQVLHHLGFVLNSLDMTVSISVEKHQKLKCAAQRILDSISPTIREVAQLIGMMVSCFLGVEYGELFYRQLEIEKAAALKTANGNFDHTMSLSTLASADISWWIRNALTSKKRIDHGKIRHTLYTDASTKGWGANLGNTTTGDGGLLQKATI